MAALKMANGSSSSAATGHVIFPSEAESFIQELRTFDIREIGSERWSLQRERLEQLNMQAVYNVSQQADEFVKEFITTHEKLPVFVHELLAVEIWREKVLPKMLEKSSQPTTSFPAYLVLYHEGTLASLLETCLYYRECCESGADCILDLLDYCHRRVTELLVSCDGVRGGGVEEVESKGSDDSDSGKMSKKEIIKELKDQQQTLLFGINMKVISILRYITDHLSVLPLSVTTRLLNTHDIPCMLVSVLENAPWKKTSDKGQLQRYEDGQWREIPPSDRLKLCKIEGQVWLSLYHLLMDRDCQQKYTINYHTKSVLLKLRGYLTEPLLEQIPHLVELQRYLEHLSFMEPPATSRDIILEQVPIIYEKLLKDNTGKWSSIANKQAKSLLEPSQAKLQAQAKRWVDNYDLDVLQDLVSGPPKCALCGGEASKRCSRCRNEWYCGRECQVKHWKKHKPSCDILSSKS